MSNARLSILLYHRVLEREDSLMPSEPCVKRFEQQMKWVKRFYNVLDLEDAVKRLVDDNLPSRALCITFDDGYRDNFQNAAPILEKHGLTATFFIATGFLNGGIMWNDVVIESLRRTSKTRLDLTDYGLGFINIPDQRNECLNEILKAIKYLSFDARERLVEELPTILGVPKPDGLMMKDEEVRILHQKGMGIGAHTVHHPILSKIDAPQARQEIENGKDYLENITGDKIRLFAYPNGKPGQDYHAEHIEMMKEIGFDAAVSTAWGTASQQSDIYQLPRFTPWDNSIPKFLLRLAKMRYNGMEERVL
ncbi:MAG: polysaccharide deacetylase family protein [Gammaproteobacteria bacterium]|nr:polysaccharide deacetylase family protein [Gammaproteobacteria bacterium]